MPLPVFHEPLERPNMKTVTANREHLNEASIHIKMPIEMKQRVIDAANKYATNPSQIIRRLILSNIQMFEKNREYF